MTKLSGFERAIRWLSPAWALRRELARRRLAQATVPRVAQGAPGAVTFAGFGPSNIAHGANKLARRLRTRFTHGAPGGPR